MAVNEQAAPLSEDEQTLHQMGYAQELRRRMSGFSNFAVSFTIISILSGCLTLYGFGMATGGPAVIVWGWLFVGDHDPVRRPGHGRGLLQFPDRGRAVLLVSQAGAAARSGLVLVHRLVQLPRPGRGDRGHRLRRGVLHQRVRRAGVGLEHRALGDDPDLRDRAAGPRPAEPVRHPAGRDAERHQRVVAHHRRAAHRRGALLRAVAPPVGQLRVRALRQRHRAARLPDLHRADRPAARPVHVHRLRRLRAHDRGDAQRRPQRPAGHRDVDPGLAGRRLGAADRDHLRHPALRSGAHLGPSGCRPRRSSSTPPGRPGPSSCCWWSSAPSCSAACPRSPPTPG